MLSSLWRCCDDNVENDDWNWWALVKIGSSSNREDHVTHLGKVSEKHKVSDDDDDVKKELHSQIAFVSQHLHHSGSRLPPLWTIQLEYWRYCRCSSQFHIIRRLVQTWRPCRLFDGCDEFHPASENSSRCRGRDSCRCWRSDFRRNQLTKEWFVRNINERTETNQHNLVTMTTTEDCQRKPRTTANHAVLL